MLEVLVISHGWRKHVRIFPCPLYSFSHARHLNSFRMHRGRQMRVTACWLQSWAKVNLLWPRNCTNIHLTRAQCWSYLTLWIWSQCFSSAAGRVACICLYLPTETDQGCLINGSTLFSFRSVIVIRCKQRNARHQYYNGTWICSFKLYYSLLMLTTIHGWPPYGPTLWTSPAKRDVGVHSSLASPLPTQSQHLCTQQEYKKRVCWQHTKGPKPPPSDMLLCRASMSKVQVNISVTKSPIWQ